jgi:hypothetical protein
LVHDIIVNRSTKPFTNLIAFEQHDRSIQALSITVIKNTGKEYLSCCDRVNLITKCSAEFGRTRTSVKIRAYFRRGMKIKEANRLDYETVKKIIK